MRKNGLLEGKVCLVTGAGQGIGRAIARKFAEEGATVYANDLLPEPLNELASEFESSVIPVCFDIVDYNASKNLIIQIKKDQQQIDILVNNAGIVTYEMLGMIDINKLRNMFEVNVFAVIQLIQLVSRLMMRQRNGSIINIASIVGAKGVKGQLAYSASKGAVISLTLSAAKELAEYNIRVNALAPGMVGTERFIKVFEHSFKERLDDIGMGRLGKPEEIANACLFLGSDLSEYITGQIIGVDGSTII